MKQIFSGKFVVSFITMKSCCFQFLYVWKYPNRMEVMQYRMYGRMLRRDKPQAYLYGEYETVKGLGAFLAGMGIAPARQISAHSLAPLENSEDGIPYVPAEKDRINLLRALHHTLVLADDTSRRLMDTDNTFIRISMPLIDSAQVAVHMPLMGNRGADMIMETVEPSIMP